MSCTVEEMIEKFDVQSIGENRFEGFSLSGNRGVTDASEMLSQSIVAASKLEPAKVLKSIHMVFAKAAMSDKPVEIILEPMNSGRSFASMALTVRQGDRLCAGGQILLDSNEPDFIKHTAKMPAVAGPEEGFSLPFEVEGRDLMMVEKFDMMDPSEFGPAEYNIWIRYQPAPAEAYLNQALVAHFSNHMSIATAIRAQKDLCLGQAHQTYSSGVLTLNVVFHEPVNAGEWMLYAHRSPHAGRGLSYGQADIFTQDGRLVASFSQENMIRAMTTKVADKGKSHAL